VFKILLNSSWSIVAVLAAFTFPNHFVSGMLDDARDIGPNGYLHIVVDRQNRIFGVLEEI